MMDDSELLKYWEETSKEYKHGSNAEQYMPLSRFI